MDDLNRKLEEILSDPESMNKVRLMAESLLGEENEGGKSTQSTADEGGYSLFDGVDIGKMMRVLETIGNRENDNRTRLLLALKPNLSERRQAKVDSAVKLLKLIEALPLLKQAGILDFG